MSQKENNITTDQEKKYVWPKWLKSFAAVCAIFAFAALAIYFSNFNSGFSDQEKFGQFGDFIGGLLNPILTFFTICLLIWSINVQLKELELSREELAKSAEALNGTMQAQNNSYELQLNEVKRIQLQQALDEQYAELDRNWNQPLIPVGNNVALSFKDIFDLHKYPKARRVMELADSIYSRMNADSRYEYDVETITLKNLKSCLRRICIFTHEIYENIESPPIASAIFEKAQRLNDKMLSINVIDDRTYNANKSMIRLPEKLNELLG